MKRKSVGIEWAGDPKMIDAFVEHPQQDTDSSINYSPIVYTHSSGVRYILSEEMPEGLRQKFGSWFVGQTGIVTDDNKFGIYVHDWEKFYDLYTRKTNIYVWD